MKKLLGFSFFIAAQIAFAQTQTQVFKTLSYEVSKDFKLKVTGYNGQVSFKATKKPNLEIRVKRSVGTADDPWKLKAIKMENGVHIEISGPGEKEDWFKKPSIPRFDVVVSGPAVSTQVFWKKGDVIENGWTSSATIHIDNGKWVARGGEGIRRVFLREGRVDVLSHNGPISTQAYNSSVKMDSVKGLIDVENYSGETQIMASEGQLNFRSFDGKMNLDTFKGDIDFNLQRGTLRAKSFEGKMKGRGQESTVRVDYLGQSELNIRTTTGGVRIGTPKVSGARVNVGSEEGPVDVPTFLKITRLPTLKVARGQLDGHKTGRIFVRTKSGAIYLR